ncbi:unnamed protein product [Dovyalis caffra]|uniref:Uncharacterized protein n=1 Tax=Dovyalis caffra TaxID=77055 RepID=A0AAV1R882_9ROSI|nr:unnamed protein product [Dovyalis caffra]
MDVIYPRLGRDLISLLLSLAYSVTLHLWWKAPLAVLNYEIYVSSCSGGWTRQELAKAPGVLAKLIDSKASNVAAKEEEKKEEPSKKLNEDLGFSLFD